MPEPGHQDQQSYWNTNLDPQNLGKNSASADCDWQHEKRYYFTPDQLFALQHLQPAPGKRILDIGAGIGTNAIHLASEGATVVAIDIAHDRLSLLRDRFEMFSAGAGPCGQVIAVKAAAEALPFRDNVFDGAYSKSALIHTHLETSIPEVARVLHSAGVGTFIEPMTRNPLVNLYRNTLAPRIWKSIARYFDAAEFKLFRDTFSKVEIKRFYIFSFAAFVWQFGVRVPQLFRSTLLPLHALDALLMRIPALATRAWFAVIVVRK